MQANFNKDIGIQYKYFSLCTFGYFRWFSWFRGRWLEYIEVDGIVQRRFDMRSGSDPVRQDKPKQSSPMLTVWLPSGIVGMWKSLSIK